MDFATALLVIIGGLAAAGIVSRFRGAEILGLIIGGLDCAYGGGWYGYLWVVDRFPSWVQMNPAYDPWEGALWFVGIAIGGLTAAAIAIAIAWPRQSVSLNRLVPKGPPEYVGPRKEEPAAPAAGEV